MITFIDTAKMHKFKWTISNQKIIRLILHHLCKTKLHYNDTNVNKDGVN